MLVYNCMKSNALIIYLCCLKELNTRHDNFFLIPIIVQPDGVNL